MYNFVKPTEAGSGTVGSSYGLIFNGHDLEALIDGFRTLEIAGRGVMSREIEAAKAAGRHGTIPEPSTLPARTIGVKYRLRASSADDLRRKMERLNLLLDTPGDALIAFKDDPGLHYKGRLQNAGESDEITNTINGELDFYCPTPYKYSAPVAAPAGPSVAFSATAGAIGLLAIFTFTAGANATEIRLRNSLDESIAIGPVVTGRTYTLDLTGDKVVIKENGLKKMTLLGIEAGVERFTVRPGLSYNLSTGGQLSAVFTELRL